MVNTTWMNLEIFLNESRPKEKKMHSMIPNRSLICALLYSGKHTSPKKLKVVQALEVVIHKNLFFTAMLFLIFTLEKKVFLKKQLK